MRFLDAENLGVMNMLGKKNKDIQKALRMLEVMSKDEKARMEYEAREAALMDERTRIKSAKEEGIEKGIEKGKIAIAKNSLKLGFSISDISKITGLSDEEVKSLM